jgi:hypothetical protein
MSGATWTLVRKDENGSIEAILNDAGEPVALLEAFEYAVYPCATNAVTGNVERGGAYMRSDDPDEDARAFERAKAWAERVCGGETRPGDERPPFYYTQEQK